MRLEGYTKLSATLSLKILLGVFVLFSLFLAYFHLDLHFKHEKALREIYGLRLEVDNGRARTRVIEGRTVNRKASKIKEVYVPPEGSVTVRPKDPSKTIDEVVTFKYKTYGMGFYPGIQLSAYPVGIALDAKLLYYKRLGLSCGLGFYSGNDTWKYVSPVVSASYRLDQVRFLKNTELFVGKPFLTPYLITTGVRLNF